MIACVTDSPNWINQRSTSLEVSISVINCCSKGTSGLPPWCWIASDYELLLNLFQCLALGFRDPQADENQARQADDTVEPEGAGGLEPLCQYGEGEGQDKTRGPQSGNGDGHSRSANAVGKDLRNQHPGDRRE